MIQYSFQDKCHVRVIWSYLWKIYLRWIYFCGF